MNNLNNQLELDSLVPVTITIIYRTTPGRQQDFEKELAKMTDSLGVHSGHFGIKVIKPIDHTTPEYHLIFTFMSMAAYEEWFKSDEHKQWLLNIESLIDEQPIVTQMDGLEVWLNIQPKNVPRPSRHKMAFMTWVAIFPLSLATSSLLGPIFKSIPLVPRTMLSTLIVVIFASYVFLPLLVKSFSNWLTKQAEANAKHFQNKIVVSNPYTNTSL